jgi:hypothetical protein
MLHALLDVSRDFVDKAGSVFLRFEDRVMFARHSLVRNQIHVIRHAEMMKNLVKNTAAINISYRRGLYYMLVLSFVLCPAFLI